jgi:hypothetical protein
VLRQKPGRKRILLNDDQRRRLAAKGKILGRKMLEVAASPAANVVNGWVRSIPGGAENRWAAPLGALGSWLELAWDAPQTLRQVHLTFDTGFEREWTFLS